ncbi:MAG: hypothetical protein ACI93R_001377 [Flavobacteriales bacterium]|jgi:hypothetical protein
MWGGPHFRFPYSEHSFMCDLGLSHTESFILRDDLGTVLSFGQYTGLDSTIDETNAAI